MFALFLGNCARVGVGRKVWAVLAVAAAFWPVSGTTETLRAFTNDFEAKSFRSLFSLDPTGWTHFQSTFARNKAEIAVDQHQSGESSLRLFAVPSTSTVSKAAIERESFEMRSGQNVKISAWFFIPPDVDLNNLFLMDVECRVCWPKNSIHPDKNPGVRMKLRGTEGSPVIERRKIGLPDMRNELDDGGAVMPRGRWFKLEWRMMLDPDEKGTAEILIDDETVFRSRGTTFVNPAPFLKHGIELRDTLYDRFQIGITANSTSNPIELYVDTVSFSAE